MPSTGHFEPRETTRLCVSHSLTTLQQGTLYRHICWIFIFKGKCDNCLAYCVQSDRSHIYLKMSDRDFAHHQHLDEDDLVEDCAPFGGSSEYLKKPAHHFSTDKCDSVCDSGVDLRSVESCYSSFKSLTGSLPVVAEKRSDTENIAERLEGLSLHSPKYTSKEETKCSLDDGYRSYDGYISYDPTRQISPEVFQLYSQDNDGDS